MSDNVHKGHRQRVRERVMEQGMRALPDHEILEILLFYTIPRGDTNEIAHALLNRFGTLKGVMDADQKDLITVKGIGPESAILIKLLPEYLRRYLSDDPDRAFRYDTFTKIGEYLYRKFIGITHEQLYMMMFNNRLNLLDCVLVSEGTVNCSEVMLRRMSEAIIHKKAAAIVLAHNHPDGLAHASSSDLENTETIRMHLENMGVQLLDHLVFADQRYVSVMKQSRGIFRVSPISQKIDQEFFARFYGENEGNVYRVCPAFPGLGEDEPEKIAENDDDTAE